MSYSFTVRAGSKGEAKSKVAAELEKVVAAQPDHEADQQQANAVAAAFIDVLADDEETKDVALDMHGSLAWGPGRAITSANISVSASLVAKDTD